MVDDTSIKNGVTRGKTVPGAAAAAKLRLDDLANTKSWVAWREETRTNADGTEVKTKVPYDPQSQRLARIPTNPETWGTRKEAERRWRKLDDGRPGGVGVVLGELDDRHDLMGIDLDRCIDNKTGILTDWSVDIIDRFESYAEVSPSGLGVKLFFLVAADDVRTVKELIGTDANTGKFKTRKAFGAGEHKEVAIDRARFYAVTDERLEGAPETFRVVRLKDVRWLVEEAGPAFLKRYGKNADEKGTKSRDESGSAYGFHFMLDCKRQGMDFAAACAAIRADKGKAGEWAHRVDERQLQRAWDNAVQSEGDERPLTTRSLDQFEFAGRRLALVSLCAAEGNHRRFRRRWGRQVEHRGRHDGADCTRRLLAAFRSRAEGAGAAWFSAAGDQGR